MHPKPALPPDDARFVLPAALGSARHNHLRALDLAPGVSLLLCGQQATDTLTPAERDAREVAIRLRELAQGQMLHEAADREPEIPIALLEELASTLERNL